MTTPDRSHGRKSIRESLKPRALDGESPDLVGIWRADIITPVSYTHLTLPTN